MLDAFLSATSDQRIVSAVAHAPLPIGSDNARRRMLLNYNKQHRPEDVEMAAALRDRIDALKNFRDAVVRELHTMLR